VRGAIAPGGLEFEHHLPRAIDLHALVGQRRARDGAAQLFPPLALVRFVAHARVQADALMVGTQLLFARSVSRHRTLHRQNLLPGARAKGSAVS